MRLDSRVIAFLKEVFVFLAPLAFTQTRWGLCCYVSSRQRDVAGLAGFLRRVGDSLWGVGVLATAAGYAVVYVVFVALPL